jgi:hypothetical protein
MGRPPVSDAGILPRSLDPLPGESLGGYLLRLSWRLRVSPARLARITECAGGRQVYLAPSLLLTFDAPRFARAARLSTGEAAALGIAAWADRCPAIAASLVGTDARVVLDGWAISTVRRYCPECLAGDDGPVQREYGGPWKRIWHLPFTFACVEHSRFLLQGCPEPHPGDRPRWQLISNPSATGLHPVQCRLSTGPGRTGRYRASCGVRLDQAGEDDRLRPSREALSLQERLAVLLSPQHPAGEAAHAFADLRLISTLLSWSWPRGESWVEPALVSVVAEHADRLRRGYHQSTDRQPVTILATAGLLTAAAAVRAHDDLKGAVASLARPAHPNPRQLAAGILSRHRRACSPRLFQAALPLATGPNGVYYNLG